MKVAVSSSGRNLDSQIDPRFGRCAYFLIVETDDMSYEALENENLALGGGAGISSAQFVSSKGVGAVLTGNCGPNAVQALSAAGVELFINQTGTVKGALERYKNGELRSNDEANVSDHYGIDQQEPRGIARVQSSGEGVSMSRGMVGGRGMGMGRGMGRGRGMSRGMSGWNESNQTGSPELSGKQDLSSLKKQAADLKRQMEEIQTRIKKLENK